MNSEYEKGVAILDEIRHGDDGWLSNVLAIREGRAFTKGFREISLKSKPEPITQEEAARALLWAEAIWHSEQHKIEERLLEALTERDEQIKQAQEMIESAERNFKKRVTHLRGDLQHENALDELIGSLELLKKEAEHRQLALAPMWRAINRERLLAKASAARRASGAHAERTFAERLKEEDARHRDMDSIRAWIEREESRASGEGWRNR